MNTTLAERLKLAMAGPPKITGLALARACGIAPPSVSEWLNGSTKRIDGLNLIAAAEFLRVDPKWLATGLGVKTQAPTESPWRVAEPMAAYNVQVNLLEQAAYLLRQVRADRLPETIAFIRLQLASQTPEPQPHAAPTSAQGQEAFKYEKLNRTLKPPTKKSA